MDKKILIEVCCGSVDDAMIAEKAGADRVELNSSMFFGGLTPSAGSIQYAKEVLTIPVMVMIRPRGGGFCYTDAEFAAMERDVEEALKLGADGIVFGILKEDGTIDEKRCERLVKLAGSMETVFHRAIDVVPDPFEALDKLVELGVKRVLTKGQENMFEYGAPVIKKMFQHAAGRIEILPSGAKIHNVETVLEMTGCSQIHIASYVTRTDTSALGRPNVYFGSALRPPEDRYEQVDYSFVETIRNKVDTL